MAPQEGLYTLRSADSIASMTVDGVDYVVTANEGDDAEYGDFEEKVKGKDIFIGATLGFAGMTADEAIFSPTSITEGLSRFFNDDCDEVNAETPFCSKSMRFSVGSSMVDFSNPEAPNIYRLAGIGGRGITIFKVTDSGLEEVWDSAEQFEKEGCAAFPWAHNSIQDEEFAPVGGAFYNSLALDDGLRATIEEVNDPAEDGCEDGGDGNPGACPMGEVVDSRSLKDGPGSEAVVVGEACGSMYAVTVAEKNSIGFVYDISDVTSPVLEKVIHLSPASETSTMRDFWEILILRPFSSCRTVTARLARLPFFFRVHGRVLPRYGSSNAKQLRQPHPSKLPLVLAWLSYPGVLRDSWPSFPSGCKQFTTPLCRRSA